MIVVPRIRTPISADEAKDSLIAALRNEAGSDLSGVMRASLLSLIWIETARGQSVNNHNVGNITASETRFQGKAWRPPWFEIDETSSDRDKALHQAMLENKAPSAFRAYDSLAEGMRDFVRQLFSTFPEVISAAKTGDPNEFRLGLAQKYSKDYENPASTKTFDALFREFGLVPKGGEGVAEPLPLSSSGGLVQLPTLRKGFVGPAVRLLGALLGTPSERFGSKLESELKAFQKRFQLRPDGICGPRTWSTLTAFARTYLSPPS